MEQRMFLGDSSFYLIARRLLSPPVPLAVVADGAGTPRTMPIAALDDVTVPDVGGRSIAITAAGRAVVRGEVDAVRLNGIDAWYGGVHLAGTEASWRWDPAGKTLISCR
jgi:hypothetical protein